MCVCVCVYIYIYTYTHRLDEQDLKQNEDKFLVSKLGSQLFHDTLSWTLPCIITTAQMDL